MKRKELILLIDDEKDFLEIIGKFLIRRKVDFMTANDCYEALDLFREKTFDIVLLDVCMPGMDGLECMAELKKLSPSTEIIFLTGHASLGIGVSGMKKGALDYCLKPIDFEELYEKILLARKRKKENIASTK